MLEKLGECRNLPKAKKNPWKIVWDVIGKSDVILEVVDARFPSKCRSFSIEKKILTDPKKSLIIVLNKSDLIPREIGEKWVKYFLKQGIPAALVSAQDRLGTSKLRKLIMRYAPKKEAGNDIIVGVVGLPNTGKSSLINIFKGRSSAPTAPVPGFTKAMQLLRIGARLLIYDTPGVIPSAIPFIDQLQLGIIRPERLDDPVKAALILANILEKIRPGCIEEYCGLPFEGNEEFFEKLALKRHRLRKGGEPDIDTISRQFIMDHIKGRIKVYEEPPQLENKKGVNNN